MLILMKDIPEIICNFLTANNIGYNRIFHNPITTIDEGRTIALSTGIEPCKSLFLGDRQKQFYLFLTLGEGHVDLKNLAKVIQSSRLSFVDAATLETNLNTVPGAVSPLSLIFDCNQKVNSVIDRRILTNRELILALCVNDQSVVVETQDFINHFFVACNHNNYRIIDIQAH